MILSVTIPLPSTIAVATRKPRMNMVAVERAMVSGGVAGFGVVFCRSASTGRCIRLILVLGCVSAVDEGANCSLQL